ncbi:hypothetical protein CP061683_1322A, partial [Chlamydia psittaci 06-1683]
MFARLPSTDNSNCEL